MTKICSCRAFSFWGVVLNTESEPRFMGLG